MRALLLLFCLVGFAHGEVYKWIDANGNTHFGDKPTGSSEKVDVKDYRVGSVATPTTSKSSSSDSKLDEAEQNYKKVRSEFYETENPDRYCREAVDRQDYVAGRYQYGSKRKKYLCPRED